MHYTLVSTHSSREYLVDTFYVDRAWGNQKQSFIHNTSSIKIGSTKVSLDDVK